MGELLAAVPTGGDSTTHPEHHRDLATVAEALQAKVGTGSSTPTTGKVLTGTGAGTSAWQDPTGGGETPTLADVLAAGADPDGTAIAGANGATGDEGGDVTITGGAGDDGNDAGASITVGGGSGSGSAGVVTITGEVLGSGSMTVRGAQQATEGGGYFTAGTGQSGTRGGNAFLAGGDAGTGLPGGNATLGAGYGDDGNSQAAEITCNGGSGGGAAGTISITTGGLTFQVIGGTASPSAAGGVAAAVASLYARDNGGTGELWVKTGSSDTAWTQVV